MKHSELGPGRSGLLHVLLGNSVLMKVRVARFRGVRPNLVAEKVSAVDGGVGSFAGDGVLDDREEVSAGLVK